MSTTPNLGLPYIDAGQAQKHVTHNEALRFLDALVQLAVQDRDLTAPPSSPGEGQRWIVKTGATDAWSGHADHIAAWQDGAWQFSAPVAGWVAYVIDEEVLAAWDGDSWNAVSTGEGGGSDPTELQDMTLLGIGTTADTTNPFSAKLNNVLWTAQTVAEGGDGNLRYKLSKESAAKTLSFLLQDNFAGCAEIGLTGDDDFHFKVSPDGTTWLEAIKIDHATGKVSFPISGGPREVLAANRTYYVRVDGGDSNNGLADTSGGAFATLQKAYSVILTLDLNGFAITIQLADGTYTDELDISSPPVGGMVTINGNVTTPSNVILSATNIDAIALSCPTNVTLQNFKIQTVTGGNCIRVRNGGATVTLGAGMIFGSCAAIHIRADNLGRIQINGSYSITGSAVTHLQANNLGIVAYGGGMTVTLTGTPAFSSAFANADANGLISVYSTTFSGSATGKRYNATLNAIVNSFSAGVNALPGNVSGTTATGGLYG